MKRSSLTIILLCLGLCGCAGKGTISKYDIIKGKPVLTSYWEFKGRNIRGKTEDGAEIETKSINIPSLPQTVIGR